VEDVSGADSGDDSYPSWLGTTELRTPSPAALSCAMHFLAFRACRRPGPGSSDATLEIAARAPVNTVT